MPIRVAVMILLVTWIAVGIVTGAESPTEIAWTMPQAERSAVDVVIARAIAAGLPDAKGGTLYVGELSWSTPRATSSNAVQADHDDPGNGKGHGLHLKLSDGTWIANMSYPLRGISGLTVDASKASAVTVDQLVAQAEQNMHQRDGAGARSSARQDEFLRHFAPDQRAMMHGMEDASCVYSMTGGSEDDPFVQVAYMIRLGMPHIYEVLPAIASLAMWDHHAAELAAGTPTPLHLIPVDEMAVMLARVKYLNGASGLRFPSIVDSLRHMLAMHFYMCLTSPGSRMEPDLTPVQLDAAVLALADPGAAPTLSGELVGLIERSSLSPTIKAGNTPPSVAMRLACWGGEDDAIGEQLRNEADDDHAKLWVPSAGELAQLSAQERLKQLHVHDVTMFGESDLDTLIGLVGDHHPCRWLDHGRYRTIGDNALRAIAVVMGCDPRVLIGRDPSAEWSEAERQATSAALAQWWSQSHGKPLVTLIGSAIERIPLLDLARQVAREHARKSNQLLDHIASAWSKTPPKDPDVHPLATILAVAKDHAAVISAVKAWPITGKASMLLIAWHLEHGDSQPFDVMFAKELASPSPTYMPTDDGLLMMPRRSKDIEPLLSTLLIIAYHYPSAERLKVVRATLEAPPETPSTHAVLDALGRWRNNDLRPDLYRLWGLDVYGHPPPRTDGVVDSPDLRSAALPMIIYFTLLKDQRQAPAWFTEPCVEWSNSQSGTNGTQEDMHVAMRICDVAVCMLVQGASEVFVHAYTPAINDQYAMMESMMQSRLLTSAKTADFNKRITMMRQYNAPFMTAVCAAAGLPEPTP